jgi:hypothetical protein
MHTAHKKIHPGVVERFPFKSTGATEKRGRRIPEKNWFPATDSGKTWS